MFRWCGLNFPWEINLPTTPIIMLMHLHCAMMQNKNKEIIEPLNFSEVAKLILTLHLSSVGLQMSAIFYLNINRNAVGYKIKRTHWKLRGHLRSFLSIKCIEIYLKRIIYLYLYIYIYILLVFIYIPFQIVSSNQKSFER